MSWKNSREPSDDFLFIGPRALNSRLSLRRGLGFAVGCDVVVDSSDSDTESLFGWLSWLSLDVVALFSESGLPFLGSDLRDLFLGLL